MSDTENKTAFVQVQDLHFKYPVAENEALKGVSFEIQRGEFVGITGPSGAGKTTLALCLRGLIPHAISGKMDGRVIVCGMDTRTTPAATLGEKVGLVFQDPEAQIIGLTVAEDLAFAPENYEWPRERILARIPELLKLVRLNGFQARETYSLSGGQKQRVAIAGALMMTPELLILDEPTSELDPIGKEEVFDAVRRLRDEQNVTIIMIEHAVEQLAEFADRIFVMDAGKIVAEAPPRELFRNVELFHRTGGERLPQVAELLFALEQEGIITPEQFTPYEAEAVTVLSQILGAHHG
jgi:energy-coupling factor transporter ATP-binding protein EcfA2